MKSKILFGYLCLIIISTSCSKEKAPGIVGEWMSVSVYQQGSSNFEWTSLPTTSHHEFIKFKPDARFYTYSDTPGRSGTYSYDQRAKTINLNYEADTYGNNASDGELRVERVTEESLILAVYSSTGELAYKTEFQKVN